MWNDNDNDGYNSTPPLLPLLHEQIYDNNPHKNPQFIEEGLMFFTRMDDPITISHYSYCYIDR